MRKTIDTSETATWLMSSDNFLILTHRRPDGDTIGSAGALTQGLRELGKTAYALYNLEITPRYTRFIDDCWAPDDFEPETVIAVDIASLDMLPANAGQYKDVVSLCIDHHASNTRYADLVCLDDNSAACGEVIFDILYKMSGRISRVTAERLYAAISTDTGCFAFGNTTSTTLTIAAQLIEMGAPNRELNKKLFRTKTRERIKIEGMLTAGIEFHFDGSVAIASISKDMMDSSGASEDDLDDIAAIANSIEGVGVGITIREMTSGHDCKISVRTVAPYDANEICMRFGGGGHHLAAGATIEKTIPEIKEALLKVLEEITFH